MNKVITRYMITSVRIVKVAIYQIFLEAFKFTDRFKPFIRKRRYRSFLLCYSRGTSLIERIRIGHIYEKETSISISANLSKSNTPVFMDVGANIGLMTLNVLADASSTRVYAFEPGMHQYSLLKKTIEFNHLAEQVSIYNMALGREVGCQPFATHNTRDASGDGFIDTGRSGVANEVMVLVQTIDNWWKEEAFPMVDVVKIDTEGAELWVLEGAVEFLSACKPIIYLEIWPVNLLLYPYKAQDIILWLNKHGYGLCTLTGSAVTPVNISAYLGVHETFVAMFDDKLLGVVQ